MTRDGQFDEILAALMLSEVEKKVGSLSEASLARLHLALAEQIAQMLRSGASEEEVSVIVEQMWHRLGELWAQAGDFPLPTHRNESAYVS